MSSADVDGLRRPTAGAFDVDRALRQAPTLHFAKPPARILIVDDEQPNRQLLEGMLAPESLVIRSAESGEQAIAMVAQDPPDLILLDAMMPGMNGYQVAGAIKGNPATRNIPVIMLTAMTDPHSRMLGLKTGAEDLLSKPVNRDELCVRVRNLLRLKEYADHDKSTPGLEGEAGSRATERIESERVYKATFDAAPVGIVHIAMDGKWVRINPRLCELLGYTQQELLTSGIQELVRAGKTPTEADALQQLAAGTVERQVFDEQPYRRRDGSVMWGRVNVSVIRDAEGKCQHFVAIIENITERRGFEAKLRQANRMEAIGRFAGGVAHDLDSLLSVILSYSERMGGGPQPGESRQADVDEIKKAAFRAAALTRRLVAFSRQRVPVAQPVDLNQSIAAMETMLRRLLGARIGLTVLPASGLANIQADPGQIQQLVMNLVVNARNAMPQPGNVTIETTNVEIDERGARAHDDIRQGPYVVLAVSDTGSGMDKETQARIVEPFFTTKETGEATGLGLATVVGIVKQSGGHIRVTSEPGEGTTFKVYFPRVRGASVRESEPPAPNAGHGTETILLVEDDEQVRVSARGILRRNGYAVLEAPNGGEALLIGEQHPSIIHLLLTDVVLPRMTGRHLSECLKATRPEMKVLFMSGYTHHAIVQYGVLDSGVPYLEKPRMHASLTQKVREALEAKRADGEGDR
ncbi:MAG: response regulator [Polyangiaceae bacterium]